MRQLFEINEKVIIYAIDYPKYNGQTSIITCVYLCPINGYGYQLEIDNQSTKYWKQKALRKYHPPSTKSFTEIMEELKGPVKA